MLPTGRRIAYDVYGDPAGTPCFYFHGWPSSRLQGSLMHEVGLEFGLCIVAMDRPGIGQSDYQPLRCLLDWPPVIQALADHLGWEKFHLIGVSGGGPYVLVLAHAMPERVLSAHYVCGAPPLGLFGTHEMFWPYRLVLTLRNWFPWLLSPSFALARAISRCRPDHVPLRWLMAALSQRDREALSDPVTFGIIAESLRECLLSGVPSVQADGDIYMDDWGFDLQQIRIPVHVWHGEQDRNIPWSYAKRVAALLPAAITHWCPGEGHYSLAVFQVREIAKATLNQRVSC